MKKSLAILIQFLSIFIFGHTSAIAAPTATPQTSSAAPPKTKAGLLVGDWMKLCRAPNLARMTNWVTANLSNEAAQRKPAQARAGDFFQLCAANGGLRIVEATQSDPGTISLKMVGPKSGIWFQMSLTANDGGKLERSGFWPITPAESAMPKDLSDAALSGEVKSIVARLSRAGLYSGIVTVARGTQIIASASGGYADHGRKTPITDTTQFTLGSMAKMFTAASVGQLVDQKKLSFDDTVGKFFPDYPNQTVRDKVTVGMLLSHTAGMGDFLDKRTPGMMKNGTKRAAEFMPLYDMEEPLFPPGTGWQYSNAGLALAGAIVEKVSGEDYPDYLRQHIFAATGMKDSDPNNIPHTSARLVTPYTRSTEPGTAADWHEAEHDIGSPAGGAISTAADLVRFAEALRNGKLVSKATLQEMVRPHGSEPSGEKYGYAMEIDDTYGCTVVGHNGGFPGVSTHLHILLDTPYTVVVLANQDPPSEEYAGLAVVALVAEKAKLGQ